MAALTNVGDSLEIQSLDVSENFLPQTKATVKGCLSDTITKYGPVPRTVYEAAIAPATYENTLGQALKKLTYDDLVDAIHGAITNPSALSHQIILIKRDVRPTTEFDEDTPTVDFISDYVASQVMQRLHDLDFRQAVTLLSLFRTSPETSTAGGWLFEALAHRVLTSNVPVDDWMTLPPLRQMKSTRGTPMKFSAEIPVDRTVGRRPLYLPIRRERLELYSDVRDVSDTAVRKYLIPQKRNNPLFDSLLFGTNPSSSEPDLSDLVSSEVSEPSSKKRRIEARTVYVLQMTTSHNHKGSEKGLQDLTILKAATPDITFVFVLVVPQTRGDRTFTWEMPQGWSKTRGLVYCQEIPAVRSESYS